LRRLGRKQIHDHHEFTAEAAYAQAAHEFLLFLLGSHAQKTQGLVFAGMGGRQDIELRDRAEALAHISQDCLQGGDVGALLQLVEFERAHGSLPEMKYAKNEGKRENGLAGEVVQHEGRGNRLS
jgi:hypothetical protein